MPVKTSSIKKSISTNIDEKKQVDDLLIHEWYFELTKEYQEKYGDTTVILMQVGSFFESYGVKNKKTGEITHSNIADYCYLCDLSISEKKIQLDDNCVLVMAGFRDNCLDKYLEKMMMVGLTAVVYEQKDDIECKNGKKIRELQGVYSPGTYISYDTDNSQKLSNNIMCIWLDSFNALRTREKRFICGISTAHIFTGESSIFEYDTGFIMNPTTFDELERYVSIISPSEVLIVSSLTDKETNSIIQYSGIKTTSIHKIVLEKETDIKKIDIVANCRKQNFIRHMLSKLFGEDAVDVCNEFNTHTYATQSLCFLMNYIQEHNPDLVRKLSIPKFQNISNRMVLANHTLKQLNIIDDHCMDGKNAGKFSSISSLLNNCCCPMGRRLFNGQIVNPVFDEEWLNKEYEMTSQMLSIEQEKKDLIRRTLGQLRDIEKMARQIVVNKIYPNSIYSLCESLIRIKQLNTLLRTNTEICHYLTGSFLQDTNISSNEYINKIIDEILDFINSILIVEKCSGVTTISNVEVFIKEGVSMYLDETIRSYNENNLLFHNIRIILNSIMQASESKKDDIDYIKIHETEKSGATLQITKTRGDKLKKLLQKDGNKVLNITNTISIPISEINFKSTGSSNYEIEIPLLTKIIYSINSQKDKISREMQVVFSNFLKTVEITYYGSIEQIILFIAKLDVLQCKAYIAKKYNYCRPVIDNNGGSEKSYFSANDMRHPLIEHIQQNELYVTNDITMGSSESDNGILLFGTNAVGKTSFIRAVGISIIMAQSGIYVPCSRFIYKPYTSIFSRILGNDNIFKGLSTFAVEMSELRIILKMADENSLVLGDELCSGTEVESALSIFSAGLIELDTKKCTYLFATHFHEITHYEEIKDIRKLSFKHMSVHYDREQDVLVYCRKLKNGSGSRVYGLEVCKSLYLGEDFIEKAYQFRNKYFPESRGELSSNPSIYNTKKIRGLCEICKESLADETHHLSPQKKADKSGFIDTFHKNHPANLAVLCESCHDKIHKDERQQSTDSTHSIQSMSRKKTTKGYTLC